jgi:hypothetical protein
MLLLLMFTKLLLFHAYRVTKLGEFSPIG